jgi:hypothetical protein
MTIPHFFQRPNLIETPIGAGKIKRKTENFTLWQNCDIFQDPRPEQNSPDLLIITYFCGMKRSITGLITLLLSGSFLTVSAQTASEDALAKALADRYRKVSATKMTRPGYRIQIYFGSDRVKAQEIRTEFMRTFPEQGAYLIYQQPNFKVRVGDFRTRIEAQGFLKSLYDRYVPSFIVPDEVKLPNFD